MSYSKLENIIILLPRDFDINIYFVLFFKLVIQGLVPRDINTLRVMSQDGARIWEENLSYPVKNAQKTAMKGIPACLLNTVIQKCSAI